MKSITIRLTYLAIFMLIAGGCSTVPKSPEGKKVLSAEVQEAVAVMKAKDPTIEKFFDKSYGYAVLPKIFKAAIWLGGAGGRGEVFEKGTMIGYCRVTYASLGLSFGGEFYREIVFFRDKEDLDAFKTGEYTFAAQATAVAITAGAAAKADYKAGTAVFIMADKGLMVDASIGGQKFKYVPKKSSE
jgi:lipid-binding SYLF domain-containing protein